MEHGSVIGKKFYFTCFIDDCPLSPAPATSVFGIHDPEGLSYLTCLIAIHYNNKYIICFPWVNRWRDIGVLNWEDIMNETPYLLNFFNDFEDEKYQAKGK